MKPVIKKVYNDHGKLIRETYWLNGEPHREDGPAFQEWNKHGQLIREAYWLNGERHREDGPAFQVWNDNGQLSCESYFLNGKRQTKTMFKIKQWTNLPMEFFE